VKLTTFFHIVLRLRIHGTVPLLPQYVSMAWYLVKHRVNYECTHNLINIVHEEGLVFLFTWTIWEFPCCWSYKEGFIFIR